MKKLICLVIILLMLCGNSLVYAEESRALVYYYHPAENNILIQDVYSLAEKYAGIDFKETKVWQVLCEDGYVDYICVYIPPESEDADINCKLTACLTQESINISAPREDLEEFIRRNNLLAKEAREKYFSIREKLKEEEYTTISIEYPNQICVWLSDGNAISKVEEEGLSWDRSRNSRKEIYAKLQYLWEERGKLNLADARIYNDLIIMQGYDTEEEFKAKLTKEGFERDIYIQVDRGGSEDRNIAAFIEEKRQLYPDVPESVWTELEECIGVLSKNYTEYNYENLFTLVFQNCDSEKYLRFDKKLDAFADQLAYHKNENNPFDEACYGDSKFLALKRLLSVCKKLHPDMSYQRLYDLYGREIEESEILTQEEKRSRYLWNTLCAERQLHEQQQRIYPAAAGFGVLAASCAAVIRVKGRKIYIAFLT